MRPIQFVHLDAARHDDIVVDGEAVSHPWGRSSISFLPAEPVQMGSDSL